MELIWVKCEAVYFCSIIWTTQIALNRLMKFVLWRSGFEAVSSAVGWAERSVPTTKQRRRALWCPKLSQS